MRRRWIVHQDTFRRTFRRGQETLAKPAPAGAGRTLPFSFADCLRIDFAVTAGDNGYLSKINSVVVEFIPLKTD